MLRKEKKKLVKVCLNSSKAVHISNKIMQELCQGYHDNLKGQRSFDMDGSNSEPATALLWLLYYLAQHHDHLQDHQKAVETLEEAMTHTPTLIELYMLKGNVLQGVPTSYKQLSHLAKL